METIRKIITIVMLSLLLCSPIASATDPMVRKAGMEYAKVGEGVMVDGPFYLNENPYWIVDYTKKGEVQASLVYEPNAKKFVTDRVMMRNVFATREFKNITTMDPLFYVVGDPTNIPIAAKYETQNVRNFAVFAPLTEEENATLDAVLEDYERAAQEIAICSELTNSLLRPGVSTKVSYESYPPSVLVEVQGASAGSHFSYEGCQRLLNAYDDVHSDYSKLVLGIKEFTGTLEDLPPGTVIREKHDIKLTKESILEQIDWLDRNGQVIKEEIDLRGDILNGDYIEQIESAEKRLQIESSRNLKIGVIFAATIIILILRFLRKRPGVVSSLISISLAVMVLLAFTTPVPAKDVNMIGSLEVPSPDELISQKVTDISQVQIRIFAEGISITTARKIIEGYPLILEGEDVYVSGPYYHDARAYYLFEVVDDGVLTGDLIVIDAITFRKVVGPIIGRLMKARFLVDLVQQKSLYQMIDANLLEDEAMKTNESSIAVFLARLAENVREGKELEQSLLERADFETARDLARQYKRAFILLQNMEQMTSPAEVEELTHGFAKEKLWLEAYALFMRSTLSDDHLKARQGRYRGRSLNRIPMMQELAAAGLVPSKPQVAHDLSSDLVYDNPFLWRLGKMEPPLFARLPLKLGEISVPGA
ncbi:MAG: 4-alpha-glucanotransferase [Euryarchaeota archaeon]|nr:4-alpha-glucanotransferase [Euryarchaeota archaeon]